MIYQYNCPSCVKSFDVIKSVKDMEAPETCAKCGTISIREFVPSRVHFIGTAVTHAEYNPGLGAIVKNKAHKRDLMKMKGLEEVGSEPIEKLHKHFDTARTEKLEKAYEETTQGWVGDGSS